MAKIDRLGWADGMSFTAYGVKVGVRVNDRAILKDVIARLPPGSKPAEERSGSESCGLGRDLSCDRAARTAALRFRCVFLIRFRDVRFAVIAVMDDHAVAER